MAATGDGRDPAPAKADESAGDAGARAALVGLVLLAGLSPWAFGAAHPAAARAVSLIALGVGLAVAAFRVAGGRPFGLPRPALPAAALLSLGFVQLLPLPAALLAALAPGPGGVWHPAEPAAAAVLGPGPHPLSIHPEATERGIALALGIAVLALLAAPALRERRVARRAVLVVVAGGLAVAVFGLVARLAFGNRLYGVLPVPTVAPFGPFVSKNHFAGYVEMVALLALGLAAGSADAARRGPGLLSWIDSPRAGRVVVLGGLFATAVLAVGVSLSRGGIVSLGAGLLAFAALRAAVRRTGARRGTVARAALAFALVVPTVLWALPPAARDRMLSLSGITTESSGAYRLGIWADTLSLARSSPLVGFGYGAFADALPRFKTGADLLRVEHAESEYLELLAEGGLVAVGLLAVLLGLAGRAVVRGLAGQPDRLLRGLGLGAAAGVVTLLVHSAFDFNLRLPSNALLFAFCAAAALGAARVETRAFGRRGAVLLTLVLLGGLVLAGRPPRPSLASVRPELRAYAARPWRDGLRLARAESAARSAVRTRPADAEAWLVLAWTRAAGGEPAEARALAAYAVGLDPRREALADEAARLLARLGPGVSGPD